MILFLEDSKNGDDSVSAFKWSIYCVLPKISPNKTVDHFMKIEFRNVFCNCLIEACSFLWSAHAAHFLWKFLCIGKTISQRNSISKLSFYDRVMDIIMGKRLSSSELTSECPNPMPAVQFSTSEIQSFLTVSSISNPFNWPFSGNLSRRRRADRFKDSESALWFSIKNSS